MTTQTAFEEDEALVSRSAAEIEGEIDQLLTRALVDGPAAVTSQDVERLSKMASAAHFKTVAEDALFLSGMLTLAPLESIATSLAALRDGLRDRRSSGGAESNRRRAPKPQKTPAMPKHSGGEDLSSAAQAKNEAHSAIAQGNLQRQAEPAPGAGTRGNQPIAASTPRKLNFSADRELLKDFVIEAREHLATIEEQLLALERNPSSSEGMHAIFRAFHTIKGMAGFLELESVQGVAHQVETLLDLARNERLLITPAVVDVVLQSADFLKAEVDAIDDGLKGKPAETHPAPSSLMDRIRAVIEGAPLSCEGGKAAATALSTAGEIRSQAAVPASVPALRDTKADSASLEVLPPVQAAQIPPSAVHAERRAESPRPAQSNSEFGTLRVETGKLDYLLEMIGEMVIAQSLVQHHPAIGSLQDPQLVGNLLLLSRITKQVQSATMAVRMMPIENLFNRSARVVRDLARKAGKDVKLEISGAETEIDRKIAEELSDPLLHMIRNALDHGIEPPAERIAAGKPAQARLRLSAYHEGGQIVVEIAEDGRGLNRERILNKARQNNLIAAGEQLSDDEVFQLIFEPGFSTAEKITDVSGRGVGMDVVRKHVQKLRGRIEIASQAGKGTQFLLKMPLTLAIIDALVVQVGDQRYLLPVSSVRQIFRPAPEMLSSVHGSSEMVLFQNRLMPIVRLHQRFHLTPRTENACEGLLIEVENEGRSFCLLVDDLLGRQEVVMKSLGELFKNVPGVASCAILGDGRVGLILDVDGIYCAADQRLQTAESARRGM